ncbi:MAG: DNA gyrase inhibitor YacG [Solimonas sp.]
MGSCPQCGQSVRLDESNPWRPFCSERCKLLDLGEWFSGRYGILSDDQTPPGDPDRS